MALPVGARTRSNRSEGQASFGASIARTMPEIAREARATSVSQFQRREGNNMAGQIPQDFRRVIIAASVGNVIEWYDFYIFGSLAAVLSVKFFEQSHPVAALLSTIALFTAGFLIRPLGAFLFGWLGDRVGRKYTFLITLSGMGLGTGVIGMIPTFQSI